MARHGLRRGSSDAQGEHKYLGELQARIMEVVWSRDRVTVREVLEALSTQRDLAYTTVMTVMTRLWEEGTLVRTAVGKTYVYQAARNRQEFRAAISSTIVHDLVTDFGDVALAQFAQALEHVDPARLARLRAQMSASERADDDT